MNNRIFFLLLVTVIGVGVLVGGFLQKQSFSETQPAYAGKDLRARPQKTGERSWRPAPEAKVFTLTGENPSTPFFGPLRAKMDSRGHLFVIDYGDFRIKEFSPDGQFLRAYGSGKGQGPGEFTSLNDVAIGPDEIWVSDYSNGRISVFALDGRMARTVKTDPQPYRIAVLPPSGLAIMQPPGAAELFGLFTADGTRQRTFGRFLADQAASSLALDGWLEPDGRGGFVYAGLFASVLAGYDGQGHQRFVTEILDPIPLPKLIRNDKGAKWVDREAPPSTISLSVDGGEIYALRAIPKGLKRSGGLDVYDLSDGSYRYSRKLPESCSWVVMAGDHMITVTDTTVSKWKVGA